MNELKMKILSKIHKGKNIIQYKRSYKHPLIGNRYFSDNLGGYFKVTKIWNIKRKEKNIWLPYEKDHNIDWEWKVEIIKDDGKYIFPLHHLFNLGLYDEKGKKVSSENMFIFYK